MVKKIRRTKEQQEYRDNLAHDLKKLRNYGDAWKDLAQTLLDNKKATKRYLESLGEGRRLNKKDSKRISNKLVEEDNIEILVENLDKFEWLNKEVADYLVNKLTRYSGTQDEHRIWWMAVAKNLDKFEWLDYKEMAESFIKGRQFDILVEYLDKFEWLDPKEIVNYMINNGRIRTLACDLHKFKWLKWLDKEIAEKLIEDNDESELARNLDKFEWLDKDIADKLIEAWELRRVSENLDKFKWLDHKEILREMVRRERLSSAFSVRSPRNLSKFKWLDKEMADYLISNGCKLDLELNLGVFDWLDKEIAEKLNIRYVVGHLEKFEWLDHKKILDRLIEDECWDILANNLEKFEWLDHKRVADELIKHCEWHTLVETVDKFKWLDKEIAWAIIRHRQTHLFVENIEKFEWLDKKIAEKLIKEWYWDVVAKYPEKFWLKKEK